jgi:general secretion pathway protein B
MSFILDALKKSESDRQRQNGPALYEVKVAAPKSQLPLWAIGLAALLGINLVIVAWALLKRPTHPATSETARVPVALGQPPVQAMPITPGAAQSVSGTPTVPQSPTPQTAPTQQATVGSAGAAPGQPGGVPQAPGPAQSPQANLADTGDSTPARGPGSVPRNDATQQGNPDDYAPAAEPGQISGSGFHARQGTASGVPLYSQVATEGSAALPQLRLDLHAYAAKPEDRFVLINMKKLREGDSMPEGVKVESITPDGVVLSHQGSRFLLPRE